MITEIKNAWIIPNEKEKFYGSLFIKDEKILGYQYSGKVDKTIDGKGNIVIPGLIDIHFHGSHGYDFISNPKESVYEISKQLVYEGTTSFMASLTVISHKEMISLLDEYKDVKDPGSHFLGIHSEGPYLSKDYKAVMDDRFLRNPSINELNEMMEHSNQIKVMTVACELEGMDTFIPYASKFITCMIGHTNSTAQQALHGLELGSKGFTHLYNAMSQHSHRNPGCVTAAFLSDAYSELICDGFHVHPDIIKATYKILGPQHIVLITDASLCKGLPDGEYIFSNLPCIKKGNTVRVKETGRIAGSAISMLNAIQNMKKFCNCSINELVEMACINPADCCNIKNKGKLEKGYDADLIFLDEALNWKGTMISGKLLAEDL